MAPCFPSWHLDGYRLPTDHPGPPYRPGSRHGSDEAVDGRRTFVRRPGYECTAKIAEFMACCVLDISALQENARPDAQRDSRFKLPNWPMIIFRNSEMLRPPQANYCGHKGRRVLARPPDYPSWSSYPTLRHLAERVRNARQAIVRRSCSTSQQADEDCGSGVRGYAGALPPSSRQWLLLSQPLQMPDFRDYAVRSPSSAI